jgi:hypothetical protein
VKQGLKVTARHTGTQPSNEIKGKIMEVTGLSDETVIKYLGAEFKQESTENKD